MASGYLSASEAAKALGIRLPTLYSYVSRGLLRSEGADQSRRTRRYLAEDVQRLKARQEMQRDPQKVVDTALHWGTPLLDSALTLIEGGRCYYRGQDSVDLAVHRTVEEVAALLWTGEMAQADALFAPTLPALPSRCQAVLSSLRNAPALERFQIVVPLLGAEDLAAYDFRPAQVVQTGARLLRYMTLLATEPCVPQEESAIATALQRAWVPNRPEAAALFNAALILCADHELNVSAFTARCVASAGSPPYAVVSAGLAALQGIRHGGSTEAVTALFREAATPAQARATVAQRLRRGEAIPGFGHPLYPKGDPRGRLLVALIRTACPHSPGMELASALSEAAQAILQEEPNIDFALGTLCTALELPPGTAVALFALGRTIGWTGHALEQYLTHALIRPRARYTGIVPNPSAKQIHREIS